MTAVSKANDSMFARHSGVTMKKTSNSIITAHHDQSTVKEARVSPELTPHSPSSIMNPMHMDPPPVLASMRDPVIRQRSGRSVKPFTAWLLAACIIIAVASSCKTSSSHLDDSLISVSYRHFCHSWAPYDCFREPPQSPSARVAAPADHAPRVSHCLWSPYGCFQEASQPPPPKPELHTKLLEVAGAIAGALNQGLKQYAFILYQDPELHGLSGGW